MANPPPPLSCLAFSFRRVDSVTNQRESDSHVSNDSRARSVDIDDSARTVVGNTPIATALDCACGAQRDRLGVEKGGAKLANRQADIIQGAQWMVPLLGTRLACIGGERCGV